MASASRIAGMERTLALFDRMEPAAREELGQIFNTLGPLIQEQQRDLAPERTGNVRGAITWQAAVQQLRLRVGLLFGKSRNDAFYGRIVHFGRKGQTVLVERRRRVDGQLRTVRRRKRVEDIVARYALHVKPRAARPFVVLTGPVERVVDQSLADFWSKALGKAGA